MGLSITTDYATDTGDPSPYLRRIADAGFTHIHWCHHWNTDFLYSESETAQIHTWLRHYGLQLLDLHGSVGPEKNWASPREYERIAGVELVKNRIEMTARLGGDVIVMHILGEPGCEPLRKSLAQVEGFARDRRVRIALENGSFETIGQVLDEYSPDYLGLCYDSGHGNVEERGMDHLEALKDRFISVHLNDNDGAVSGHSLLFSGTVDWARLARIMAESAYAKCVSMELRMSTSGIEDEATFLDHAFETGARFAMMIEKHRTALQEGAGADQSHAADAQQRA
jgi:sugar phosphate isomerase/epimerase